MANETDKAWCNAKHAGAELVIIDRKLVVDADGFIVGPVSAEETAKLHKLPGWAFKDRNGAEVIGLRLDQLAKLRATYEGQADKHVSMLADLKRRIADCDEQIARLSGESESARKRAEAEAAEAAKINLDGLTFDELRSLAAQHKIEVSPKEKSRDRLLAALRPLVNPASKAGEP